MSPAKAHANVHDHHNRRASDNYQLSIEEMFKGKPMTFDDIEKLNYEAFTTKGGALKRNNNGKNTMTKDDNEFRPSDILDIDDEASGSEDEILKKFSLSKKKRTGSPTRSYKKPPIGSVSRSINPSE